MLYSEHPRKREDVNSFPEIKMQISWWKQHAIEQKNKMAEVINRSSFIKRTGIQESKRRTVKYYQNKGLTSCKTAIEEWTTWAIVFLQNNLARWDEEVDNLANEAIWQR